jgi:hypothetical protein
MGLLKKAKNETSYLKMALYGEAGSGKTFTSSLIAIGLCKYIKADKPCGFLDTETGSDFMIPMFEKEKIEFLVTKSRAFQDCLDVIDEAEKKCSVFVIDSLTHIWNEMTESYCRQNKLKRITINHWPAIKQTWRELTRKFINSNLHIIMAGRSADKWEDVIDEEGVHEVRKVGTKMRSETEIQYEPNLLVELEQVHKSPKAGSGWTHRAWVIKDRWNEQTGLEGEHFDNPTFESFLPHVKLLSIGKKHRGYDNRTSDEMFKKEETGSNFFKKRDILLEKIKNEIHLRHPSNSAVDKSNRIKLLDQMFGTKSFEEISNYKNLQPLKQGLTKLEELAKEMGNESSDTIE